MAYYNVLFTLSTSKHMNLQIKIVYATIYIEINVRIQ